MASDRRYTKRVIFLRRLAQRRCTDKRFLVHFGFCCVPWELGMTLDEFIALGEPLIGGQAILFQPGVLGDVINRDSWDCTARKKPHVFYVADLKRLFNEDGTRI